MRTITQDLGETLGAVNGTIAQFTQFNGLIDQSTNSNLTQINNLKNRIAETEKNLSKQEETLNSRYARLETVIGRLNSQQAALQSLGAK